MNEWRERLFASQQTVYLMKFKTEKMVNNRLPKSNGIYTKLAPDRTNKRNSKTSDWLKVYINIWYPDIWYMKSNLVQYEQVIGHTRYITLPWKKFMSTWLWIVSDFWFACIGQRTLCRNFNCCVLRFCFWRSVFTQQKLHWVVQCFKV